MNKQKHESPFLRKTSNVRLQKSSVIFMQLGLILALLFVYIALEHESIYKIKTIALHAIEDEDPYIRTDFRIEVKKKLVKKQAKKIQKVVPQKSVDKFKVVKNTDLKIEDIIPTTEVEPDESIKISTTDIVEVDPPIETKEPLEFFRIEIAPAFPGCKGSSAEKKACFNEKMRKHINRKFDVALAQTLGLKSGKKRIRVQFIIDEKGDIINIKVAAPHKRLEKEAKRVIKLLPRMIPATQRLSHVKVRYNLPILFNVEDY